MWSSAFFAHRVPSLSKLNVVPISWQHRLSACDVCSSAMSHVVVPGAPISFANYFTACDASALDFIGTTHAKPFSMTNGWQQLCPQDNLPACLVAKNNATMKKRSFMRLHRSILSFAPQFRDSVGSLVCFLFWDATWSVHSAVFESIFQILDK